MRIVAVLGMAEYSKEHVRYVGALLFLCHSITYRATSLGIEPRLARPSGTPPFPRTPSTSRTSEGSQALVPNRRPRKVKL